MSERRSPRIDNVGLPLDLKHFSTNGCADLGLLLDPIKAESLRAWIDERQPIMHDIFYSSPDEFAKHGRWERYAPGTNDHNLLISSELDLSFIEDNQSFRDVCSQLCGADYQVQKKSIIRSTPRRAVPAWILEETSEVGRPNLNPYVRDQFQNIQYFLCTDFHQDKTRSESDFVTVYLYLDEVEKSSSPLRLLKGSHVLGMTVYPHSLRRSQLDRKYWFYSDNLGNHERCEDITALGGVGSGFCFHCLTLHGTGYNDEDNPRISLRYLIKRGDTSSGCLLRDANRRVIGPHTQPRARLDVDPDGRFLRTGSTLLGSN